MRPWLYDISQNLGHISYIARIKHSVCHMTIVSIHSYVLRRVRLQEVTLSRQINFKGKLVLLHQFSEVYVVNRAQLTQCFHEFVHCSPPLLAQGRKRGRLTLTRDLLFPHLLHVCTFFGIQRKCPRIFFFTVLSTGIALFCWYLYRFTPRSGLV